MTTDKPSIAELQAGARRRMGTTTLQDYEATGRDLIAAAPVLLEIAAAALAANSTACDCHGESGCDEACSAMRACRTFETALAKVRP